MRFSIHTETHKNEIVVEQQHTTKCVNAYLQKCRRNNDAYPFLYDFETNSVSIQREVSSKVVVHEKADATIENVDAGHCVVEGQITRCFPSFLVVGIQKSGTTALSRWLSKHPSLRLADGHRGRIGLKGEAHFFDAIRRTNTDGEKSKYLNYKNFIGVPIETSWREYINRDRFVIDEVDVGTCYPHYAYVTPSQITRTNPGRVFLFDKTPAYFDRADPQDVAKLLPSARLILITRDPVERLNSAFYHCHRSHGELRSSVRGFRARSPRTSVSSFAYS